MVLCNNRGSLLATSSYPILALLLELLAACSLESYYTPKWNKVGGGKRSRRLGKEERARICSDRWESTVSDGSGGYKLWHGRGW